ncbi:MAG: 50S ribosomal protein L10 [Dehalococcoidales bacterium]|nr:50S ribosomal protein L10 [Dehalococcoidales bacterium]
MKKEGKAVIIDNLEESFKKSSVGILTNYKGLKNVDLLEIRKRMRTAGGKFEVVKNTLAKFAADKAGYDQIDSLLNDTTAIAFGFKDARDIAVALADYIRTTKTTLSIKGGFLGSKLLTPQDVQTIATLPTREVLLAMLLGQLQSPIVMLMGQLNAPVSGLVNVLNGRKKQLEGGTTNG